jgi:bacillithiol system protein YtxJ
MSVTSPAEQSKKDKGEKAMMWTDITEEKQLREIQEVSKTQPVLIFKHSTRCSISSMAKNRLERSLAPEGVLFYFLDLIRYREISNRVAQLFHVHHESPQVLLIRNGECVYDDSHNGISMEDIVEQAAA